MCESNLEELRHRLTFERSQIEKATQPLSDLQCKLKVDLALDILEELITELERIHPEE